MSITGLLLGIGTGAALTVGGVWWGWMLSRRRMW